MGVKRILMVMLIAALYGQGSGQSEPRQYCIVGAGPGGMCFTKYIKELLRLPSIRLNP